MPKRKKSRKDKGPHKASAPPGSKAGRICMWCGHALAAGALACTCLGQGIPASAQVKPAQPATPPAMFTLAPDRDLPPPRYSFHVAGRKMGWPTAGGFDDQDRPESDVTLWTPSSVFTTGGTADASAVRRAQNPPDWLPNLGD